MQRVLWLSSLALVMATATPGWSDRDCDRDDAADRDPHQRSIRWPTADGRSLQATLDAAPSGSRIELGAGDFTVRQPLVITDKHLTIIGAGSDRRRGPVTRLVGPAPQAVVGDRGDIILPASRVRGVWSLIGANVTIAHVVLTGFDAGIVTTADAFGLSGPTVVRDVEITNTGRGILALGAGDLTVKRSTISNTRWNGISIAPAGPAHARIEHTTILPQPAIGIYVSGPTTAIIDNAIVAQAEGGGIVALECDCEIASSILSNNTKFGISVQAGTASIHDSKIVNTHPAGAFWGDGINVSDWNSLPMKAVLENNEISNTDRAGVSVFGADASLEGNVISCAAFDIDTEEQDQIMATVHDDGGDVCGCPAVNACEAKSSMLAPPPPIAGLE